MEKRKSERREGRPRGRTAEKESRASREGGRRCDSGWERRRQSGGWAKRQRKKRRVTGICQRAG